MLKRERIAKWQSTDIEEIFIILSSKFEVPWFWDHITKRQYHPRHRLPWRVLMSFLLIFNCASDRPGNLLSNSQHQIFEKIDNTTDRLKGGGFFRISFLSEQTTSFYGAHTKTLLDGKALTQQMIHLETRLQKPVWKTFSTTSRTCQTHSGRSRIGCRSRSSQCQMPPS